MYASLIISTLGRSQEILRLFHSLTKQTFRSFEVIVVDQNFDDRLQILLDSQSWSFPFQRIHTPDQKGVSRGRNMGSKLAKGNILLFPDDDCWYPDWLLQRAADIFEEERCDGLTGRAVEEGTSRSINGRFETSATWVTTRNVWTTQIEWVAFYTADAFLSVGGYNEDIGLGADSPWQASEGPDLTLRMLNAGRKIYYDPTVFGHHKEIFVTTIDQAAIKKARAYARGFGHVLREHNFAWTVAAYWIFRSLLRVLHSLLKLNLGRARLYSAVFIGRIEGFTNKIW